jgi:hypothetical protein
MRDFSFQLCRELLLAKKAGREVGVRGRPHILNGEEENQFVEFLKAKYDEKRLDIVDARAEVMKIRYFLSIIEIFF